MIWCCTRWHSMPPEWNTRSMVDVPELFVCGLLHDSDPPTLLGSAAFSRATLSNSIWLSSRDRPRPKYLPKGRTWACAAAERRNEIASALDNQRRDHDRIHLSTQF